MMVHSNPPGAHCKNRVFEWAMAFGMSAYGLHILIAPNTLISSRYSGVLLIFTASQFAAACLVVGFTRILALAMNGNWPTWGPRIRAIAAIFAAAIWLQLAVSLAQRTPSPGMWIYVVLMGAELVSVVRARRDVYGSG